MKNWSTDVELLKKHPDEYAIWRLEQLINFGLGKEKINEKELRRYWSKLQLDPSKKAFLSLLLDHGSDAF